MSKQELTEGQTKILATIVGLIFIIFSCMAYKADIDKKNRTDSKITSSYVTHVKKRVKKKHGYGTSYLHIYHYNVNGTEYTCNPGITSSPKSNANKTVFYKASNPNICYVNHGKNGFLGIFFLMGVLVLFLVHSPKKIV